MRVALVMLLLRANFVSGAAQFAPNATAIPPNRLAFRDRAVTTCECSATTRGHPSFTADEPQRLSHWLRVLGTTSSNSPVYEEVLQLVHSSAVKVRTVYGEEGLVNLDASLREASDLVYCAYDSSTGINVANKDDDMYLALKRCDFVAEFATANEVRTRFVPSPPPGPDSIVLFTPMPTFTTEPTEEDIVEGTITALPEPDFGAIATLSPLPSTQPTVSPTATRSATRRSGLFEGCVAVEHLKGRKLQHTTVRRPVLCAFGLCATPNHALLVSGTWTSMREKCDEGLWKCDEDVKAVNNLHIPYGTRVRFNEDIVITPYDARFPIALTWLIHIVMDIFHLLYLSSTVACFATVVVVGRAIFVDAEMDPKARAVHTQEKLLGMGAKSYTGQCQPQHRHLIVRQLVCDG